jgi:hypothetical protein
VERRLGFGARGTSDSLGERRAGTELWPKVGDDPTGGAHLSVRGGGGQDTILERGEMGFGLISGLGQIVSPRPFSCFLNSFPFLFLVF